MSELIDNESRRRKELLKHLILQLHGGVAPPQVQKSLVRVLGQVPYGLVVEVEQELMAEGLPVEEVTRLCHLHGAALEGVVSLGSAPKAPPGHPAHTFRQENAALGTEIAGLEAAAVELAALPGEAAPGDAFLAIREHANALTDVEKHYLRKEHLLFPFLEKHGITGPPKVMWGKHDETRALLKAALEALAAAPAATAAEARAVVDLVLAPASRSVREMIDKEEQILLPMCLDTLAPGEWYEIARQSTELGFCLYDPPDGWRPEGVPVEATPAPAEAGRMQLPSGSFLPVELAAMLNTIPFDLTYVDADDRVRYFTQGTERIFARSRAILGRKVQHCHPPASVDVVERILSAFRAGRQDRAAFWIELKGRFISIEYFALRSPAREYLGCLEVSQDLTEKRALTGQQRLLSWTDTEVTHA